MLFQSLKELSQRNMKKNKIFNPKFTLALGLIVILSGAIMVTELNKRVSATTESSSNWDAKPVVVNIQVDLEKEEDQARVFNILNEIEKYNGYTTVFVSGEFASKYPEVVRNIESRGHEIAVHGWQKGEDLTLLSYQDQLTLIQKSFSAVRMGVIKPENILDFKPQRYKFNDDTIRILQNLGVR